MTTALITTCYREAASIGDFLDAVLAQTRQPDEVVIVDAGSDDGTIEAIRARIEAGASIRLIVAPGATRSEGRNRAIHESAAEVIAVTDVGALPRPDWFERITAPLLQDLAADVVSGYYEANPGTLWESAVCAATVPLASEVSPDTFLPSARSVAFRRDAWERAGGYPEHLRHNEDTPFGVALRASGARFVFEPQAIVEWRPQTSPHKLLVQFYRYARGDAQCGIWYRHYAKAYALAAATVALIAAGLAWPAAWLGLPALAAAYWLRHAARALRRTRALPAGPLAPVANLIVDLAHLVGYTRGLLERRPHAA